ncbi:FtsX-like permease family protein [Corynebacterium sp.]|uniref:FtsX-like permease family protein n=1 Tax=Corynebacterium sp. TaxID=1720 RepID=UPI0026DAC275|nr:FtsX-like permease family protein [Corynebacterium sp.]MDO4609746.1 FtsX-like permease family protein [Corynebacterium sp.]
MTTPRVLAALAGEFTTARWTARSGDGVLTLMSVVAFAVVTLLANIVAAGTWMFVGRSRHPSGMLAAAVAEDPSLHFILDLYIFLAGIACAMLVVPAVGLATSATVLGARARERRLATLRLLGMTRSEVSLMGFLDVMLQVLAGVILGSALTLPALHPFTRLSFQAMPVTYGELLMPWWAHALTALAVMLIAAVASAASLLRVQISPLGVTRRGAPRALRWWRLAVLAVIVAGFMTAPAPSGSTVAWTGGLVAAMLIVFLVGVDLSMPYVVQVASRLLARAPWVTVSWAARRVIMEPKQTWRRIGAIATLLLLASFAGRMPVGGNPDLTGAVQTVGAIMLPDVRTGLLLTVGFAFALAAVSTMINQASAEFERADETRAMLRMGVSRRRTVAVSWTEVLGPLAGASVLALALGWVMGLPFTNARRALADEWNLQPLFSTGLLATAVLAGFVLMVLALAAVLPIHRRIADRDRRR